MLQEFRLILTLLAIPQVLGVWEFWEFWGFGSCEVLGFWGLGSFEGLSAESGPSGLLYAVAACEVLWGPFSGRVS